jgi:membrane protease subunit HflC
MTEHHHSETKKNKVHHSTMLLGIIVAVVFLIAIFSYQLQSTNYAVISTLGHVQQEKNPGLHFRWPYPIQKIYRFDNRLRCFEGNIGKLEETLTADRHNIIIGIYVVYKVEDPVILFQRERNIEHAEENLNSLMRSAKNEIVGKYKFSDFVNTGSKNKLDMIEKDIYKLLARVVLEKYGLKVTDVGIKSLGIPEKVTGKVIERMKNERNAKSEAIRQEGLKIARKIRDEADKERKEKLAIANANAKIIRSEGDAQAASYYSIFKEEPELAIFLKKLDALKRIVEHKTTLVIDTKTAPFDLLQAGAERLE